MQTKLNPADQSFVTAVEEFLAERAPVTASKNGTGTFLRALSERGWSVPRWPRRWGGAELSPRQSWLLDQTLSLRGAPQLDPVLVDLVGPLLMTLVDHQQLDRWLPAIARGESLWVAHVSLQGGPAVAGTFTDDRFFPSGKPSSKKPSETMPHPPRLSVRGAAAASRLLLLAQGDSIADIVSAELPAESVSAGVLLDPDQVDTSGLVFNRLHANRSERQLRTLLDNLRAGDALRARNRTGRLRYQLEALRLQARASQCVSSTALAELSVALLALEALEHRAQNRADESLSQAVTVRTAELGRQLLGLTVEALGYYALPAPDPRAQHNELPVMAMTGQDAVGELIRYVGGLEEMAARDRFPALETQYQLG